VGLVNATGFTLQPGPVAIFARGTFVADSLLERLDLDETLQDAIRELSLDEPKP
jgi:hypothetical protein